MNDLPTHIDFPGLTVRRLRPEDHAMVCAHREAMFLEAGGAPERLRLMTKHFAPWLRPRLEDGRYYGFVLLDQERPVAAIGLMDIEWPPHPNHPTQGLRGYVLNVYVAQSHRRRGLARRLMQLAEAEFAQRGLGFAVLHATEAGRPVYAGLGWAATTEMAKPLA